MISRPPESAVLQANTLGFTWETINLFLFRVHRDDAYPEANAQMGPAASLAGHSMGRTSAPTTAGACSTAAQ